MRLKYFKSRTQIYLEGENPCYADGGAINGSMCSGKIVDIQAVKGLGVVFIREGNYPDVLVNESGAGPLAEKYQPVQQVKK